MWTSRNLFHVAWKGNFEIWVLDPLHVRPIALAIWDPNFGRPVVKAFTRGCSWTSKYCLFWCWCLLVVVCYGFLLHPTQG